MTEREHGRGEGREPLDEEAAWAQIVAGYGEEPPDPSADPPGDGSGERAAEGSEEDGPARAGDGPEGGEDPGGTTLVDDGPGGAVSFRKEGDGDGADEDDPDGTAEGPDGPGGDHSMRTLTVYAAGTGPRDWRAAQGPSEDDHFVPPEPPPLPTPEPVTKWAWIAVLGGPALLFGSLLLQVEMTWWITTLGVGGFLGGFGTLVARMRDGRDDDDFEDPGRGAVV